jgi:hypothetical protein
MALGCHVDQFGASMLMRRVRALAVIALLWGVPWAILGTILGARFALLDRGGLGIVPVLAMLCATYGLVIGLAFGLVISAVARIRPLARISVSVSALAVAAVGFLLGARAEPGYAAAILFALFGAGCAATALRIARDTAPAT